MGLSGLRGDIWTDTDRQLILMDRGVAQMEVVWDL